LAISDKRLLDNLKIETNVIESAWRSDVRRLLFLGSSCIYPKFAEQAQLSASASLSWHESGNGMNASQLVAKQVGVSGQISLGKEYAGRTVLIDSSEPGVWVIKTAQTIPDSELWLHQPEASARLDRALLAMTEPPTAADLDALEQHLSGT
jgi:hypothetical protein